MRAKTSQEALLAAIKYYQDRLKTVEREYKTLKMQVDSFVFQFVDAPEDGLHG